MPQLFYGNFDFEHQLTSAANSRGGKVLERINAELTPSLIALAQPDDLIWAPYPVDEAYLNALYDSEKLRPQFISDPQSIPAGSLLRPWGWSNRVVDWGRIHDCRCESPRLEAVQRANSRLFSCELEREWQCGLESTTPIRSLDQLVKILTEQSEQFSRWVLKGLFGMSGRERCFGQGIDVSEQTVNWTKRRIERDGAVILEPWVDRIAEVGIQFDIPRCGEPQLLGITPLLSDDSGGYRGNDLQCADDKLWEEAIAIGRDAAIHLQQQIGYFGPLGIDAMRYRDPSGSVHLRPLQDINARLTMGRLALGFRRFLQPGEVGIWLHFRASSESSSHWNELRIHHEINSLGGRLLRTSPNIKDGSPPNLFHTLLFAPSHPLLDQCRRLLDAHYQTTQKR